MAIDVVYSSEIIDAILAELAGHLPTNWSAMPAGYTPPAPPAVNPHYDYEVPLVLMEHGDLMEYAVGTELAIETPAIVVRPLEVRSQAGRLGGGEISNHSFRIVHIREWDDCRSDTGTVLKNQTQARSRYAKIIHKAVFADQYGKLGSPTLTSASASAAVENVTWDGWDLGQGSTQEVAEIRNLRQQLWAIALDITVSVSIVA